MANPQIEFGRWALKGAVLIERTTTGDFSGEWQPLYNMTPWALTLAGLFTGSVTILHSAQLMQPTMPDGAYPILQTWTARGQLSSQIPYRWVKAIGSISALTSTELRVDLAAIAGVERQG